MIKMLFNNILNYLSNDKMEKTYKIKDLFSRKDYFRMFFGKETPYFVKNSYFKSNEKKLWVIPLPTKYKLSYWLTLEYVFPKILVDFIFNFVSKHSQQFYFLVHPADFLDQNDLKNISKKPNLERMDITVDKKIEIFEKRLNYLIQNGYEIKTFISDFGDLK